MSDQAEYPTFIFEWREGTVRRSREAASVTKPEIGDGITIRDRDQVIAKLVIIARSEAGFWCRKVAE